MTRDMRTQAHLWVILSALTIFVGGCAGPTTPFGSLPYTYWSKPDSLTLHPKDEVLNETSVASHSNKSNFSSRFTSASSSYGNPERDIASALDQTISDSPNVYFFPRHQVLHENFSFSVIIDDPRGVDDHPQLKIHYNNSDVTRRFLFLAKSYRVSNSRIKLVFSNLRLKPDRVHRITATYRKSRDSEPILASFSPGPCTLFEADPLLSTGDYEVPAHLLKLITDKSVETGVNPSLTAGLVAQESRFNPKAISSKKAIGLTQITPIGEAQLIGQISDWPRFPEINNLPIPLLKWHVLSGTINEKNEWRLDPSLSLEGGLSYIKQINDYWHRASNLNPLKEHYKNPEAEIPKLVLASYNSGPTRVHLAFQELGLNWIEDSELIEARKYVNRIMSFCSRFSQPEFEND